MSKSRLVFTSIFVIILFLSMRKVVIASGIGEAVTVPQTEATGVQVMLAAVHNTTSWDARISGQQKFELPVLYLHHQTEETTEAERTLDIAISGFEGGMEIEVAVTSQHVNVSTGDRQHDSKRFLLPERSCTYEIPCVVRWAFSGKMTHSDLYQLKVLDGTGQILWENTNPDRPDFVMLDTWEIGLGEYTVRVYYATLFPFSRGQNDLDNRLDPGEVVRFIEQQFIPIIAETWRTQFQTWGFGDPIQPDWDADKVVEIIITDPPFALFDGTGSYTRLFGADGRPYPERRIWWFSTNNAFQAYDTLENGVKVLFSHEFFHLVQWNVLLSQGRPENHWLQTFIEAQGRLAPAVQYPDIEFRQDHWVLDENRYWSTINRFLSLHLNTSYRELEGDRGNLYDMVLYWRFLYEQYGDMTILREALEEMTVHFEPDNVSAIKDVMNQAFSHVDGPFLTFEESLTAFARANYALRLENGRCIDANFARCEGFYYDPAKMMVAPPIETTLEYDGSRLAFDGGIPSSFGMDFIEVSLDPAVSNRPIAVTIQGEGTYAQFNVQIWKLNCGEVKPFEDIQEFEIVPANSGTAQVNLLLPQDTNQCSQLSIIVTRMDANETNDPVGSYHIEIGSSAGNGNAQLAS